MSDVPKDKLSAKDTAESERRVLTHFLTSKPAPHKPLGKTAQAKRRKREKQKK